MGPERINQIWKTWQKINFFFRNLFKNYFQTWKFAPIFRHPELTYQSTNSPMELDIFLPSVSLAIEYQGEQHYRWHFIFGSPQLQQWRDTEKKEACNKAGITLVEIPFWWNRSLASLAATIKEQRPGKAVLSLL